MEEFVESIENQMKTNFKVTQIPIGILKEFKKYCKTECGDIYWVGIFQLLKIKREHDSLLTLLNQNKMEDKKSIKTFGE